MAARVYSLLSAAHLMNLPLMSHFNYKSSYHRNLPHIQPPGATLFVTFRLAGSLPQSIIEQWQKKRRWLRHLAKTNPSHHERVKADFERAWFAKFEEILDGACIGPVWLSDERVEAIVVDSLHYRDGKVYRLDAFSIMANHVHAVIKPSSQSRARRCVQCSSFCHAVAQGLYLLQV
jgi:putative transposase